MLLKICLCCGKRFWIYLVDFVAVSLVSWMAIMAGFVCQIISCKLGSAVFSDDAFHDIIWVLLLIF